MVWSIAKKKKKIFISELLLFMLFLHVFTYSQGIEKKTRSDNGCINVVLCLSGGPAGHIGHLCFQEQAKDEHDVARTFYRLSTWSQGHSMTIVLFVFSKEISTQEYFTGSEGNHSVGPECKQVEHKHISINNDFYNTNAANKNIFHI